MKRRFERFPCMGLNFVDRNDIAGMTTGSRRYVLDDFVTTGNVRQYVTQLPVCLALAAFGLYSEFLFE